MDEIGAELAEVFATPPDTVRRDVSARDRAARRRSTCSDPTETGCPRAETRRRARAARRPAGLVRELRRAGLAHAADVPGRVPPDRGRYGQRAGGRRDAGALAAHLVPPHRALAAEPPFFAVELHDRGSRARPAAARPAPPRRHGRGPEPPTGSGGRARSSRTSRATATCAPPDSPWSTGWSSVVDDRAMIVREPDDSIRFRHALDRSRRARRGPARRARRPGAA